MPLMAKEWALLHALRPLSKRWVLPVEWLRLLQRMGQLLLQVCWP